MVLNGSWTVSNYVGGHRISKISWFSPNNWTTTWSVIDEPFLSFCVGMEVRMDIFGQRHLYVVYRHAKVICIGFCNAVEGCCTFGLLSYSWNTNLGGWRHYLCVYGRIYVLSRNWTLIPHLVIYFIRCSSPFTQRIVYIAVFIIYFSTCTKSSKLPDVFSLMYSMQEWNIAQLRKYMMHCQRYGTWDRNCYIPDR